MLASLNGKGGWDVKNCPDCGAANPDDAAFCSNCAFRFGGEVQPGQPQYPAPTGGPPQQQPEYYPPGHQPYQQTFPSYGGFWIRLAAYLLDYMVISLAFLPINVVFTAIDHRIPIYFFFWGLWIWPEGVSSQIMVFFNLVRLSLIWAYFIIMTARSGSTLGKRLLNLRVVGEDMQLIGYGTAALRETIGKVISAIPCLLGYFWAGFDGRKQAWHDKLAKTFVIRTGP
ncbi:MAG: RDD family protein [Actinomycetota bacterium]